ncbi:MAG: hypothetical protein ACRDQB_09320 [Thermocrispum sp.]
MRLTNPHQPAVNLPPAIFDLRHRPAIEEHTFALVGPHIGVVDAHASG